MMSRLIDFPVEISFITNVTDQLFMEKEKSLKLIQSTAYGYQMRGMN